MKEEKNCNSNFLVRYRTTDNKALHIIHNLNLPNSRCSIHDE